MGRSRFSKLLGGGVVALLVTIPCGPVFAQPLSKDAQLCQQQVGKEGQKFKKTALKAWQKCLDGVLTGKGCDATARDTAITAAADRYAANVGKKCAASLLFDAPPAGVGFTPSCDLETAPLEPAEAQCQTLAVSNPASLTRCLVCWKEAELEELLKVLYPCVASQVPAGSDLDCGTPPAACPTDMAGILCSRAIAKAGINFFLAKEKAVEQCLDAMNRGRIQGQCPDGVAQAKINAAEQKKVAQIEKCTQEPPWWDVCPEDSTPPCDQTIASVGDITTCVDTAAEEVADEVVCQQYPGARAGGIPCPAEPGTTASTASLTTASASASCSCAPQASITSNFNGTAIPQGRFIWFNSVLKVSGVGSTPVTINFTNQTIQFTADSVTYTLNVPDGQVTFDPAATLATTVFNTATNTWETVTPTGLGGNTFLSGLAFQVPVDFPGGINPVTWSGQFTSSAGVSINWQWAAAVYTTFSTDNNALGVKPVDDNMASVYQNADHAGTPENFKAFVTGGARGGGGSNFTGSLSATQSVTCECPATTTSTFTTSSTSSTQSTSTSSTSSTSSAQSTSTSSTSSTSSTQSTTSSTTSTTCEKLSVRAVLDPATGRFPGNRGPDVVVRAHLGESVQAAVDGARDLNGDGFIIVAVAGRDGGLRGGNVTQSLAIRRAFDKPFALVACSVTLHDPAAGADAPTARIERSAASPGTIFVMDLHAADSNVAGWLIEGNGRELRNVKAQNNAIGIRVVGSSNVIHNSSATSNTSFGILVEGDGNQLLDLDAMGNGGYGIDVIGNGNQLAKNDAGDRGKGNAIDGIAITGSDNVLTENITRSNLGHGVHVSGQNNRLAKNLSGGVGDQDNGRCAFEVDTGNVNGKKNKANRVIIPGAYGSAFPAGCTGTP